VPVARCFYVHLCIPTADLLVRAQAAVARLDLYSYHKCVRATMIRRDACDDRSHRTYLLHTVMDGPSPRHMHARPIQHIINHTLYLVHAPVSQFSIELDRTEKPYQVQCSHGKSSASLTCWISFVSGRPLLEAPGRYLDPFQAMSTRWLFFVSVSYGAEGSSYIHATPKCTRTAQSGVHVGQAEFKRDLSGSRPLASCLFKRPPTSRAGPMGLDCQDGMHPSSRLQPAATDFYSLPAGSA